MRDRIAKTLFLMVGIFGLVLFYGWQMRDNNGAGALASVFIVTYLDNFRKYLFIGTIVVSLVIACTHIPYLNPMIRIRTGKDTFFYVWLRQLIAILFFAFYILLCFFVTALAMGFEDPFGVFQVRILARLSLFFLVSFEGYHIIYLATGKEFLAIAANLAWNLLLLSIGISLQYYVFNNAVTGKMMLSILDAYMVLAGVCGMVYLYVRTDKKECV